MQSAIGNEAMRPVLVEKLSANLTGTDTAERNAGMLRVPHRRIAGRASYWLWLRVVLVVVAVALS
jgi:hypothetical protein